MISFLSAILISMTAPAETLELTSVHYFMPKSAPSCGLLHQRELEREKVMRELAETMKRLKTDERELISLKCLLTNKWFMPDDTWVDDSVDVGVSVVIPPAMKAEIAQLGFANIFISTRGPGFVWQSLASQLPDEVSMLLDSDGQHLNIHYPTYLNSSCERPLRDPVVEWIPRDAVPGLANSFEVVAKLGQML